MYYKYNCVIFQREHNTNPSRGRPYQQCINLPSNRTCPRLFLQLHLSVFTIFALDVHLLWVWWVEVWQTMQQVWTPVLCLPQYGFSPTTSSSGVQHYTAGILVLWVSCLHSAVQLYLPCRHTFCYQTLCVSSRSSLDTIHIIQRSVWRSIAPVRKKK